MLASVHSADTHFAEVVGFDVVLLLATICWSPCGKDEGVCVAELASGSFPQLLQESSCSLTPSVPDMFPPALCPFLYTFPHATVVHRALGDSVLWRPPISGVQLGAPRRWGAPAPSLMCREGLQHMHKGMQIPESWPWECLWISEWPWWQQARPRVLLTQGSLSSLSVPCH